jgi:CIC family chloride channel protein
LDCASSGQCCNWFPESRIGGVVEVLKALKLSHGIIPLRAILNVILSAFVLAFGGSVGPEGPMVQMGALIGSLVGQRVGVSKRHLQIIVRSGGRRGNCRGISLSGWRCDVDG